METALKSLMTITFRFFYCFDKFYFSRNFPISFKLANSLAQSCDYITLLLF